MSDEQCTGLLIIRFRTFQCELEKDHPLFRHTNEKAEADWGEL